MTFSELHTLYCDYEQALWSPKYQHVHFGCDCGCGGDSYTSESWDAEIESAYKAIDAMKAFCQKYGIHYDGVE